MTVYVDETVANPVEEWVCENCHGFDTVHVNGMCKECNWINGDCLEEHTSPKDARLIANASEMLEALQEICGEAWALDEIHPNELTRDRLYKMLKDIGMFTEKLIAKVEDK